MLWLGKAKSAILALPISSKILAISVVSSMATLIVFCAISFYRDWSNFKERKVKELGTLVEILDSNTAASVRFNDPYTANEYVSSMSIDEDIRSVCIYDASGQPFAQFSRQPDFTPHPAPNFSGALWKSDRLFYAQRIMLDQTVVGYILLEADTRSLDRSIQQSLWTSIGLILIGLAITAFMASRLQRHITDPISELVQVTQRVTEKKYSANLAPKRHNDEIGSLVDSFNEMLNTLSRQDAELRENNTDLERIVQERTEDLRQRNDALRNAIEAANAASVAKSEFLAMASHELRTPLNPIIGYVDLLLGEKPSPDNARKLELIKQSARLLLRLIDDILDFSRLERGNLKLESDVFDVQRQFSQIVESMSTQAKQKGLAIAYRHDSHGSADTPTFIVADEVRLRQVVLNLIGNAIKFTNEGSIAVESELLRDPDGDAERASLRVEVSDTGIGISASDMEKLFKPFSQIDGTWTREYGGMGLGLAISSRIVKAMKGSIECQSEKGVGSRFSFEIPVQIQVAPEQEPEQVEDESEATLDVLIVEDEPVNRELMGALLSAMGHRVVSAVDGIDALERYQPRHFHLILLDISMPRMDGFATAKAIRERESNGEHIPIIAMTAHVTPEDRERCFKAGMDDYLSKPLSFSKLRSTIQKWCLDNPKKRPTRS